MKKVAFLYTENKEINELLFKIMASTLVKLISSAEEDIKEEIKNNYDIWLVSEDIYTEYAHKYFKNLKVIILLNENSINTSSLYYERIGLDYLKVPYNSEELISKIENSPISYVKPSSYSSDYFTEEMLNSYNKMAKFLNTLPCGVVFLREKICNKTNKIDYKIDLINSTVVKDLGVYSESEIEGTLLSKSLSSLKDTYLYTVLEFFTKNSLVILEREIYIEFNDLSGWYLFRFVRVDDGISLVYHEISNSNNYQIDKQTMVSAVN